MRALISVGSASMLAMLTLSSPPATACDWGGWSGCGCGGYGYGGYGYGAVGYYGAPAYAYAAPQVYAPPTYGYAPAYYAPPPVYYAPPPYYAGPTVASYLPPGNYSPPGYYAHPSYGVPYSQPYGGRRTLDAAVNHRRPPGIVPAPVPGRYPFAAKQGPWMNKPPMPSYRPPGVSASAAHKTWRVNSVSVTHHNDRRANYVPAAYYGGSASHTGWRR
jgi:hypothetical protein